MALQKGPLLIEPVVDLIISKLQTEFPARCSDADNQYSDGISVEPPQNDAYHISYKKQALTLPACYVIAGPSVIDYADEPNYLISDDELAVVISTESENANDLTRKAWRYARLLFVMLDQQEIEDAGSRFQAKIITKRIGYADQGEVTSLSSHQKRFRQDVIVEFGLKHFEKRLT